jgi:exopolysaccharide biosynthesis operon protein EpsL
MSLIRPCLVVGAVVFGSTGALAQSQDVLKFRAGVTGVSNDNFFNTATAPVSERITSETVGINLSLPYSLQRFELDASLVANQFQINKNFDFTGKNFNGTWFWSVTPQLHGTLNSTRSETLVPANDSVDPTARNKSSVQNTALAAAYDLGGPWQVTAGVVNTNTVNERAVIGQADDHATGANAGLRYVLGSGNSLAYFHQVAKGDSSSHYVLTTDDVAVVWVLSGNTTLNGHLAAIQQKFDTLPQFDFSGTSGAANLVWRITGKTSIAAGWQRDLVSYQTANTTYTQTDAISIAPSWQISPITSVRAQYREGVLTDQGNPFGATSSREDRLKDASLTFSWQPYQQLSLTATVAQTSRSSNLANTDFKAQLITLGAVFSF